MAADTRRRTSAWQQDIVSSPEDLLDVLNSSETSSATKEDEDESTLGRHRRLVTEEMWTQRSGRLLFASLSPSQSELEERLRTVCLCICASGVVAYGLARLRFALVPLVLSLSLKYLLQPMIDALTGLSLPSGSVSWRMSVDRGWRWRLRSALCRLKLPRGVAVVIALCVALAFLATLAAIVAESVRDFTSRADTYALQVQQLIVSSLERLDATGIDTQWSDLATLQVLAAKVDLPSWITHTAFGLGEGLLSLLSTTMLVLLFTMYLLLTPSAPPRDDDDDELAPQQRRRNPRPAIVRSPSFVTFHSAFNKRVDTQINAYIKGKLALSLLVGVLTSACLYAAAVDLWLAFGVISFFTNFVPNLGALVAIALPAPVCFFGPNSSAQRAFFALSGLVIIHAVIGNIIEPIVFGHSMKLHPVTVLLSLMLWSYLWGVPGLVLAVPITAVLKIYLNAIDHPFAEALANALDGRFGVPTTAAPHNAVGPLSSHALRSGPSSSV